MASEPIGPGSLVAGRFRLEDLLEEHSGARLWRAVDLTLARNVAVHVIPAEDPRGPAVLTAARTSATVSDGRILRVLDALLEGDHISVVHEWGSGLSLDRLVAEEPLAARRAAWLVREVAEAITVAHRHGIAHGRLLPENVMVNDAGSVKLIGFVVDAVLLGRPRGGSGSSEAAWAVAPSEHESDVRNLGALLYAALTGRWPGFPDSVLTPAPLERGQVCRPRQVRSGVPRALDALCDQILNTPPGTKNAVESAAEVTAALSDFLGETASPVGVEDPALSFPLEDPTELVPLLAEADAASDVASDAVSDAVDPEATQAVRVSQPPADPDSTAAWSPSREPGEPAAVALGSASSAGAGPRTPAPTRAPADPPTGAPRTVPVHWGPDRPDEPPAAVVRPDRAGISWLKLAAVVATLALAVLAGVVAVSLGKGPAEEPTQPTSPNKSSSNAASRVLTPVAVQDFDPDQSGGPPEEHHELVPLATDGDPSTAWRTFTYVDGPELAPFKRGVGLRLDMGREVSVGEVDVTLVGGPYNLSLLAAPEGTGLPTDVTGLRKVATATDARGVARLAGPQPVRTRYLVVWLTALPVSGSGYGGQIAEVVVRS